MTITKRLFLILMLIFLALFCSACYGGDDKYNQDEIVGNWSYRIIACTGTCLTREEMAQQVYNFENVQNKNRPGTTIYGDIKEPELKLVTPGKHEHDENTRYEIRTLPENKDGIPTGIEVLVMSDTSGCKIEQPEPETNEPDQTVSGLPAKDLSGSYTAASVLKVNMKGKDEDEPWTEIYSEEFKFTYNVYVIDEKTIRIDLGPIRFGEGPYDPTTGICEFKIASEFYDAMPNAKHDDYTRRATFSRKGDRIQLELITVGKDEDDITIGIKDW